MFTIVSEDREDDVLKYIHKQGTPTKLSKVKSAGLLGVLCVLADNGAVECYRDSFEEDWSGFKTPEIMDRDYSNVNFSNDNTQLLLHNPDSNKYHYYIPGEISFTGFNEAVISLFTDNDDRVILHTLRVKSNENLYYEVNLVLQ